MKEGRKRVLALFCLVGLGIPTTLLAFMLIARYGPWSLDRAEVTQGTLNLAAACVAAAGLAAWAFFDLYLFGRLWKIFPHIGDREKAWSYADGVFVLQGVGSSMASVLGVFFFLFSGDFARGAALAALSYLFALFEVARFPARMERVEETIERMG